MLIRGEIVTVFELVICIGLRVVGQFVLGVMFCGFFIGLMVVIANNEGAIEPGHAIALIIGLIAFLVGLCLIYEAPKNAYMMLTKPPKDWEFQPDDL